MNSKRFINTVVRCLPTAAMLLGVLLAGTGNANAGATGTLWVSNYNSNSIGNYSTSGAVNATSFATVGVSQPAGISYSSFNNNVYVVNFGLGTIGEYATDGTAINTALISGLGTQNVEFMAVNSTTGALYVPIVGSNVVKSYSATGILNNPSFISTGLNSPNGIAISPITGNIFVVNDGSFTATSGYVAEYSPTGVPVNTSLITGLNQPTAVAFDPFTGNIYVSNGVDISGTSSGQHVGFIGEYSITGSTATTVNASLISGLSQPWQIAFDPLSGNFDVPNYSGTTISQYSPSGVLANPSLIPIGGVDGIAFIGPVVIPEPGAAAVFVGLGALGIAIVRRRKTE